VTFVDDGERLEDAFWLIRDRGLQDKAREGDCSHAGASEARERHIPAFGTPLNRRREVRAKSCRQNESTPRVTI
jgi:hypothetical protein